MQRHFTIFISFLLLFLDEKNRTRREWGVGSRQQGEVKEREGEKRQPQQATN